jgi:hypothetical protein
MKKDSQRVFNLKKKSKRPDRIPISDEEIYELRSQGISYDDIVMHFKGKGIKVTKETIRMRCSRIYAQKGIEEKKLKPFSKRRHRSIVRSLISGEEIYRLKEEGYTYSEICDYYEAQGIKTNMTLIATICTEVYAEKGEQIPKVIKKEEIATSDEVIFELREKGYTYKQISEYYKERGIQIGICAIRNRCVRAYTNKGIEQPQYRKEYMQRSLRELDNELNQLLSQKSKSDQLVQDYTEFSEPKEKNEEIENEK